MYNTIIKDIKSKENPLKAKILARFFKTEKGEYGEGDVFLGLTVPISRSIARKYTNAPMSVIEKLIKSKFHEVRLVALLILIEKYNKGNEKEKKEIFNFYLKHTKYINNWDLVDLSAPRIVGDYIGKNNNTSVLLKLTKSKNLWEQRIAIVSTFALIYNGKSELTYKISKLYLNHKHDLIHKATGWMLREAGKRVNEIELCRFLDQHAHTMPRTMLRYSIERLPQHKRLYYLNK